MSNSNVKNFIDKLLSIKDLNPDVISGMDEYQLKGYIQILIVTVDPFPFQKMEIEALIDSGDYSQVIPWLQIICSSLSQIYADDLVKHCEEHIKRFEKPSPFQDVEIKEFVDSFMESLTTFFYDLDNLFGSAATNADGEALPAAEVLKPGSGDEPKSIMVIYKMILFSNSLKAALSDTEYELIGATSSEAAIHHLRVTKPDLFILDEDLPGLGALKLTKAIRKIGLTSPIVYATSNINKETMVTFMEAGVSDFMMKPVTAVDVQKKVEKFFAPPPEEEEDVYV